jgi:hypothetical protein
MVKEDDPKRKELLMELESPLETPCGEQINSRPQRRQRRRPQSSSSTPTRIEPRLRESSVDDPLSPTLFDSPSSLGHHELPETPASPTHSVDDSTGQLSMDENGQVRFLGKSSGFYLLQNSRTYQNGAFHFSGYSHKLSSKITQKKTPPDTLDLPPKDLSEHLIKLYFTHFYPLLPMFYKRRLVSSFTPLEPISPLLLNAIYAVASRVTPDERVRSDTSSPDTAGDVFFERAKCLLDDYYDTPRISTVQALLLMSIHQMGAMKPARAWLYSGMVMYLYSGYILSYSFLFHLLTLFSTL